MTEVALRSPDVVMRLDRLGASHPTRLSFLRGLMRRAAREFWRVRRARWDIDDFGHGVAVYAVETRAASTASARSPRRSTIPSGPTA